MKISIQEAYVTLGIPYGSNEELSRKAYRRLISLWHPDRNNTDEAHEKTTKLNAAILALEKASFKPEDSSADKSFSFYDEETRRQPEYWRHRDVVRPARNIQRKVKLNLEEAAFGVVQTIKGKTSNICNFCHGEKYLEGTVQCNRCKGSGYIEWHNNYYKYNTQCPDCGGHGKLYVCCHNCEGTGYTSGHSYAFKVNIPPGVRNGDVLIARGVGGLGSDGKTRSDAKITIEIEEHKYFYFDKDGYLSINYPVLVTEIMRFETIIIPTLYGFAKIKLKGGGMQLIKEMGFPNRRGEPGDLRVRLNISIPERKDETLSKMISEIESYILRSGDRNYLDSRMMRDEIILHFENKQNKDDVN